MQMVKNFLLPLIVGYLGLLLFMPRTELYYMLERELSKNEIRLNEQSIEESLFFLRVKEVTLYAKGIKVGTIEEINYFTLFFYNRIELEMFEVDELFKSKIPGETSEIVLSYHMFSPLTVSIDAKGSFGVIEGKIQLDENVVRLDLVEEKEIDMILPLLQKDEKGSYYEKSF